MWPIFARWHPERALTLRWASSQTITDTVKSRLRELYKRVHPDLFHQDPTAKEANERSFKLLQEYLAAAEHHGSSAAAASLPYRFTFYVKRSGAAAATAHDASRFHKVSLTLPPPNFSMPHTTHQALSRLLTACGVEAAAEDLAGASGSGGGGPVASALGVWLPGAAEQFHQASFQHGGPRQELQATRTALQMTRRISLAFGGALAGGSVIPQLDAARRLLKVLQDCPPGVSGLRIGLGDGFGIDQTGTVWLHAASPSPAWLEFLRGADLESCHRRKDAVNRLRDREREAAKALGVGLVTADAAVAAAPDEYQVFLDRASAAGAEMPAAGKSMSKVTVLVVPDGAAPPECATGGAGCIRAPVSAPAGALLGAVRRLGPDASRAAELAAREEAELAALRGQVERKLRLRKLARHPDLPAHKYRACLLRMLQHSAALVPLVDGLPLRIAETNAVRPGEPHIDIGWAFVP